MLGVNNQRQASWESDTVPPVCPGPWAPCHDSVGGETARIWVSMLCVCVCVCVCVCDFGTNPHTPLERNR